MKLYNRDEYGKADSGDIGTTNRIRIVLEFGLVNMSPKKDLKMKAKIDKAIWFDGTTIIDEGGPVNWDGDPASLPTLQSEMISGSAYLMHLCASLIGASITGEIDPQLVDVCKKIIELDESQKKSGPFVGSPDFSGQLPDIPEDVASAMDEMLAKLVGTTPDQLRARRTHDCAHCDSEDCDTRTTPYVGPLEDDQQGVELHHDEEIADEEEDAALSLFDPEDENWKTRKDGDGPIPLPPEFGKFLQDKGVDAGLIDSEDDNKDK